MMTEQGKVLSALLNGQFICQVSDEDSWRFLKSRDNASKLEPHLNLLNRTLATTGEGEVFFAGYLTLGDEERKVLLQQFQETTSSLVPLVEWLLLVQWVEQRVVGLCRGQGWGGGLPPWYFRVLTVAFILRGEFKGHSTLFIGLNALRNVCTNNNPSS